ncbi:MAG: redoxin domain-containing protein [Rhodospirillales bacterium]
MTVSVGSPAPGVACADSYGKPRSLGEFKGKTVVLEWTHRQGPFVRKHYDKGNMQALQKKYTGEGVVWLTVVSSGPGKEGYVTAADANAHVKAADAAPTAVLLDSDGKLGRLYGAMTTPHLFVIDARGNLAYAGAIDDKPSTNPADIPGAANYVAQALDALKSGKPVATPATRAYGCGVKYAG